MHKLPQPVKLWYLSSFFRYERAQAGRFRQFWQVGAEAIGSADPAVDAELVVLLATLLEDVGVASLGLRISSLGTPETRARYRERLAAHLRAHEDRLSEDVRARIDLNPLRAFDADHAGTREVMATAPRLLDELAPEDAEHFAEVRALLDAAELPYAIDPTLVRGLDYYARTVFEFTSGALGAQSAVGGGGRYDGLVAQVGGPPAPGCGWAAGVERIVLAAGEGRSAEPALDVYVAYDEPARRATAFALGVGARRAGMTAQVELAGRSPKGQRKQADRLGAGWLVTVHGEGATVRDLATGDEHEVAPEAAVARVLRERGMP
jgi:histidyl-tRNA synthetase